MTAFTNNWRDGRELSSKMSGSDNDARGALSGHLLPAGLCPSRVSPGLPREDAVAKKAVCSEQVKKIDIEKHVELSVDEAVALYADMSDIMSALEAPHRETLKRLLKVIGTISEYSATEKEVLSVARSTMAWLKKIDSELVGKITADSLIQFAKLSSSGWKQSGSDSAE